MNVYSDTLHHADLVQALPDDIYLSAKPVSRPRKRTRGWRVRLEALRPTGRWRNSGIYGAEGVRAATWDEHGVWMARLFDLDPQAVIGYYDGRADFHKQTQGKYTTKEVVR